MNEPRKLHYCLVLGATSDIGEAIAYRFAQQGYGLLLAARKARKRLAMTAADMRIRHDVDVHLLEFDALAFGLHQQFYDTLPVKPDIVVSVFGFLGDQQQGQRDFAEVEQITSTNYTGQVSVLNIVANDFEQRRQGTIVGISSVAGERGRKSNYFYGAAKGAFSIYLQGLRNRLFRSGVHVMTVKPGFVATRMTAHLTLPKALTAMPTQVAEAVYHGVKGRTNTLYVLPVWRLIMLVIIHLPEAVFKRLSL